MAMAEKKTQLNTGKRRGPGFKKGNPGGPGRPKGKPNKLTRDVQALIWEAIEKGGGVDLLLEHKDILVGQLLPKLIPQHIKQEIDATTTTNDADTSAGLQRALDIAKEASERANVVSLPPTGTG
tara:strand:- start:424 stop:795 length:372 start_codon:yes stop_codon:yes gene_type:complete